MDNLKVGTGGELAVASKMAQLGFNISFPIGSEPYDLIAEKGGGCYRSQVKTGKLQQRGSYRICLSHGSKVKQHYGKKQCDYVVLFAPYSKDFEGINEDGYYVIPVADIQRMKKYHATIFPAGLGRGRIGTCNWEKYRDGWQNIQK